MPNNYRTIASACLIISFGALAHPTLEQQSAAAGSYYKATLKLGHGCDGAATTGVTVLIPEGVVGVKPMPKAGWMLETRKAKLAVPYESHGKRFDESVAVVTWSGGSLPDAFYDEFVMTMKLPDTPGKRWFKVQQVCASGRSDWVQVPEAGQSARDLKFPAAALEVLPAAEIHKH
jgi:uncharacterized protein YcnI